MTIDQLQQTRSALLEQHAQLCFDARALRDRAQKLSQRADALLDDLLEIAQAIKTAATQENPNFGLPENPLKIT